MKILSIISNQQYNKQNVYLNGNNNAQTQRTSLLPLRCNMITFGISKASGEPLKKLAEYGLPDMYTGQLMLTWKQLSRMLENGVFEFPLKKLIPILKKYEGTMLETEHKIFMIFEKAEKKQPNSTIEDVLKQQYNDHQKKLLNKQQPIFEKLIEKACDLPEDIHKDFMDLMRMTSKRIAKDPVITHFSENEFIYKLNQIAKQIKTTNNRKEISSINLLLREAKRLFKPQAEEKKKFGRGIKAAQAKMEYQMQPKNLKRNTQNIQYLRKIFEESDIKNNREIKHLFRSTSAKICGFPVVEPFKRKEFIYDLKNVIKFLKNKKLCAELINIARELPTSTQNVSAFMVKHVNDSPNKIGWYLMKDSLVSIEHIVPKVHKLEPEEIEEIKKTLKQKKKIKKIISGTTKINHVDNYGLSAAGINTERSNMPFDEWIRKNPQSYETIPQYMAKAIDLFKKGIFKKVGLDKSYIPNFKDSIATQSPKEKPIILDLSNFK